MSEGPTVADIRAGLLAASMVGAKAPLARAFRSFILGEHVPLADLATEAAESLGSPGGRSARHVAILGYAAAAHALADAVVPVLAEGIRWLSEKPWNRPFREATLEVDGISMLGVALGALGSEAATIFPLAELAVAGAAKPSLSDLNRSLMTAAAHVLSAPGRPDASGMLPEVRVALADVRLLPVDEGSGPAAWHNAMRFASGVGGSVRAAVMLRALDALCDRNVPARLGRLEVQDVVRVLNGVERSFQEWTWEDRARTPNSPLVRWHVENEYHVQNLLWAVLAPVFPDLRREEYATPVGHKNPRMDLTIPSLKLVIEAKFMRKGKSFADIQEEVSADNTLYGSDPRWEVLIPFIWDDSRRIEQHATLVDGLRRMSMVPDAVVMSRPGKMDRDLPETPPTAPAPEAGKAGVPKPRRLAGASRGHGST